jgi:hypothetical protein
MVFGGCTKYLEPPHKNFQYHHFTIYSWKELFITVRGCARLDVYCMGELRNVQRNLVRGTLVKLSRGRPRRSQKDNFEMDVR